MSGMKFEGKINTRRYSITPLEVEMGLVVSVGGNYGENRFLIATLKIALAMPHSLCVESPAPGLPMGHRH